MGKDNLQCLFSGFSPPYCSFWNYVSFLASCGGEEIFPMGKCVFHTASWYCSVSACLSVTIPNLDSQHMQYSSALCNNSTLQQTLSQTPNSQSQHNSNIILWHQGFPASHNSVESLKKVFSHLSGQRAIGLPVNSHTCTHTYTHSTCFSSPYTKCASDDIMGALYHWTNTREQICDKTSSNKGL